MTQSTRSLVLGGGQVKAQSRHIGQVKGAYVERSVQKAMHDTNYGLEFKTDHVLTIKTGYNVGWTFEEINAKNANIMVGSPGYGMVPIDRTLPGPRRNPAMIALGSTRRIHREFPALTRNDRSQGVHYPLTYPMANPSSTAYDPVEIAIQNIDSSGSITGYKAYVVTTESPNAESLISNIEIVPYTAVADDLILTIKPGATIGANFTIYLASVTRDATTLEFTFTTAFQSLADFDAFALPVANGDGTYTITQGLVAAPFRINSPIAGAPTSPPNPVTVYQKTTLTGVLVAAVFPTDYVYETNRYGGSSIRLTPNSGIDAGETVVADYYYDITSVMELPLASLGRNPVVTVELDILFPDQESKMIWHFFRAQINTQLRVATAETDWMGVDVTLETLDASDVYAKYGFGYLQLIGPIAEEIKEWGNIGEGLDSVLSLPANTTTYA